MSPCVECGKKRKLPAKLQVARVHYVNDDFCSRRCAEKHFGVVQAGQAHLYKDYGEAV